jgi:hypothetical protein
MPRFSTHGLADKASNLGDRRFHLFFSEDVMSIGFLALGCLFLIAGVAYLAYLMQLPETYLMVPVLLLVGVGAVTGAQVARRSRI